MMKVAAFFHATQIALSPGGPGGGGARQKKGRGSAKRKSG